MRRALIRGSLIGSVGALTILIGGTILPLDQLEIWGVPVLAVGLLFITFGLLPYKRLTRLETHPHELHYDGNSLLFCQRGKPLFNIPTLSIENIRYVEKNEIYGLCVQLKQPIGEKVRVLQRHFNFAAFVAHSVQCFAECDLFFPYFSKRSWEELEEIFKSPPE